MKNTEKSSVKVITGRHLLRMKMERSLSDSMLGKLFGLSPGKVSAILASGDTPVADPVVCYIYRQYQKSDRLIAPSVNLADFYAKLGGREAMSGSDFSLTLGRELSAYVRYLDGGGATPAMEIMIQNAIKMAYQNRVENGQKPAEIGSIEEAVEAFDILKELCREEGVARGADPLVDRRWGKGRVAK